MGAGLSVEPDDLTDATAWPPDDRRSCFSVDLSRWRPGQAERTLLLSLLPWGRCTDAGGQSLSGRPDRRRALASRLAQRRALADALLRFSAVVLARTKGGKP